MDGYILDDKNEPVRENDNTKVWGWRDDNQDRVRLRRETVSEDVDVSTVFLSMDHSWDNGAPVLWETMIFGGEWDQYMHRYTSQDSAIWGHSKIVERLKAGTYSGDLWGQEEDQ